MWRACERYCSSTPTQTPQTTPLACVSKSSLLGDLPPLQTALHAAAANGNTVIVEALLAARANPKAEDVRKLTPLHLAAQAGCEPAVRALLAANADVSASAFMEVRLCNTSPALRMTLLLFVRRLLC